MAKQRVVLTSALQQVASGPCILTIDEAAPNGAITFAVAADDAVPQKFMLKPGDQLEQNEEVETWMSADDSGHFAVIVDGAF